MALRTFVGFTFFRLPYSLDMIIRDTGAHIVILPLTKKEVIA